MSDERDETTSDDPVEGRVFRSAFWEDLSRDLRDPEFRDEYVRGVRDLIFIDLERAADRLREMVADTELLISLSLGDVKRQVADQLARLRDVEDGLLRQTVGRQSAVDATELLYDAALDRCDALTEHVLAVCTEQHCGGGDSGEAPCPRCAAVLHPSMPAGSHRHVRWEDVKNGLGVDRFVALAGTFGRAPDIVDDSAAGSRILWNRRPADVLDGGNVNEILVPDATVHIEQVNERCWWVRITRPDGTQWNGDFAYDGTGIVFEEQDDANWMWDADETVEEHALKNVIEELEKQAGQLEERLGRDAAMYTLAAIDQIRSLTTRLAAVEAQAATLRSQVDELLPFAKSDAELGVTVGPHPGGGYDDCDDCRWYRESLDMITRIDAGEFRSTDADTGAEGAQPEE